MNKITMCVRKERYRYLVLDVAAGLARMLIDNNARFDANLYRHRLKVFAGYSSSKRAPIYCKTEGIGSD